MKPGTCDVESAPGTNEQLLIERATLTRSAAARRANSLPAGRTVYIKPKTVSEDSLINDAILATSGHSRDQHKSKSVGQTPGLSMFKDLDSIDHDDVFDKESADPLEDVSVRSTCGSNSPTEENGREGNGQSAVTEKEVDTTVHRSDNGPGKTDVKATPEPDIYICGEKPKLPVLVIDEVEDPLDSASAKSHDGYREPRGSMVGSQDRVIASRDTVAMARSSGTSDLYDLPTDVYFDELVLDIAREINIDDFELLQKVFIYRDGARDCLDRDNDSPITFFRKLQRWRLLSRDNISILMETLQLLDKPHMYARAVQYIRHNWETVFFYQENLLCPPGFDKVKLYKSSTDFTRLKRLDVESMRSALASLLFLPQQSVYVVGIEPALAGGVVVTWLLPEHVLEVLEDQAHGGLPLLNNVGVYCIEISGTPINVRGPFARSSDLDLDHAKFLTVYRQLRESEAKLQDRDLEVAKLKREADFLRLELETMSSELQILTQKSAHDHIEYARAAAKLRSAGEKALYAACAPSLPAPVNQSPSRIPLHGKPSAVIEAISRPLASRRSRSVERSSTQTLQLGRVSRESNRTFTRHSFRSTVTKHTRQTEEYLYDVGRKYKRLHGRDELFEEIENIIQQLGGFREPL